MKKLIDLVNVVNRNKTKRLPVIERSAEERTKLDIFYNEIAAGNLTTDEAAFRFLYPGRADPNPYYRLKHELKTRLINTAHLVDVSSTEGGGLSMHMAKCFSWLSVAQKMHQVKAYTAARWLTLKANKLAKANNIPIIRMFCLRRLGYYAGIRGKTYECAAYYEEMKTLTNLTIKESLCSAAVNSVIAHFAHSKSNKAAIRPTIKRYLADLDAIHTVEVTPALIVNRTILEMSYHTTINDYAPAAAIGESGLKALAGFRKVPLTQLFTVQMNVMICHLGLRHHEKAAELLALARKSGKDNQYNWFVLQEMEFILLMQRRDYRAAYGIYAKVEANANLAKMPPTIQETWTINQAYLYIVDRAGLLPGEVPFDNFRVQRYLNSVPKYAKDKRGSNVPILISHFILLLQQGKTDQVIDRYDAIMKYRDRYLKRQDNYRANIFIRICSEIVKANFQLAPDDPTVGKYLDLLTSTPVDVMQPTFDQEVIPYEHLYGIIQQILNGNIQAAKRGQSPGGK